MAITAAIAMSSATVNAEQRSTATCTITNSGSADVNLISVSPYMTPHGLTPQSVSTAVGQPPVGGAFSVTVPGSSGTLKVSFDVIGHAPITSYNVGAEPSQFVYDVGAIVTTSDGSVTTATTATLTVNYPAT